MSNKFTDYDMRKFSIKDARDIFAFFDAVKKGIDQSEIIVKKLGMSNAAQASVIKSLQRSVVKTASPYAAGQDEESIIQSLGGAVVSEEEKSKAAMLDKMRAASSVVSEADENLESPSAEDTEAQDADEVSKVANIYRGYERKVFANGQIRYLLDGKMTAAKDVPAKIKEVLDEQAE